MDDYQIIIKRASALCGRALQHAVELNGFSVGTLKNGQSCSLATCWTAIRAWYQRFESLLIRANQNTFVLDRPALVPDAPEIANRTQVMPVRSTLIWHTGRSGRLESF